MTETSVFLDADILSKDSSIYRTYFSKHLTRKNFGLYCKCRYYLMSINLDRNGSKSVTLESLFFLDCEFSGL